MKKPNLVLIQPFGVNSIMLREFLEYLNEHFNTYFIDLPGSVRDIQPLEEISPKILGEYVTEKLNELDLDEYILGGISMGFIIIGDVDVDKRCKGILAIQPCLGNKSLRLNIFEKLVMTSISGVVSKLDIADSLLHNDSIMTAMRSLKVRPKDEVLKQVREHMYGKALVDSAYMLLTTDVDGHFFKKLPHVLVMNNDDATLMYEYIVNEFSENVDELLILESHVPHNPDAWSREYFEENIPVDDLEKIKRFFIEHV